MKSIWKELHKWHFGYLMGIISGVVLIGLLGTLNAFLAQIITFFLALDFLFIVTMWMKVMPAPERQKQIIVEEKRAVCPECGSPARHKKDCSKAKK